MNNKENKNQNNKENFDTEILKIDLKFKETALKLKKEEESKNRKVSPFRAKSTEASKEIKNGDSQRRKRKKVNRGNNGIQLFIDSMKPSFLKTSPDLKNLHKV